MITVLRIDERLIHGQVAHAWSKAYPSDAILVIDNDLPSDKLQVQLLNMATPKGMKCFVKNTVEAMQLLKKFESKRILVVVRNIEVFSELIDIGYYVDVVNVGGIYHKDGRYALSNTVYLDAEISNQLNSLLDKGVRLEIRATPTDEIQSINKKMLEEN